MTPEQFKEWLLTVSAKTQEEMELEERLAAAQQEIQRLTRAIRVREDYPFHCTRCGAPHNIDTSVPSAVWNNAIRPLLYEQNLGEMLCTLCIDEMVSAAGLKCEVEFYFTGDAIRGRLYDDDQGTNEMLRRDLAAAQQREARLRDGLKQVIVALGPSTPQHGCEGCEVEMETALYAARVALGGPPEGRG